MPLCHVICQYFHIECQSFTFSPIKSAQMVKLKRRYLLVELLFSRDERAEVTGSDLYHSVLEQVGQLHGDCGAGAVLGSFQVKVCDLSTNIAVLRVSAGPSHFVQSALPFLLTVGRTPCTLRLLFEGSSMRTIERFLIRWNLRQLYARLRVAQTEEDKQTLRSAIRSVTGPRVAHIRF